MPNEIGSHGFGLKIEHSRRYDTKASTLKLSSTSSPPMRLRGDDSVSCLANEHMRSSRVAGSEALSSKGFSSVSVQNVHVMGRLPHVDGPSDGQRPSALSMLSVAGKANIPRAMPQSVPSSDIFYGSCHQGVRGGRILGDDVFRPPMLRKDEM
jgi:hypothetical protein